MYEDYIFGSSRSSPSQFFQNFVQFHVGRFGSGGPVTCVKFPKQLLFARSISPTFCEKLNLVGDMPCAYLALFWTIPLKFLFRENLNRHSGFQLVMVDAADWLAAARMFFYPGFEVSLSFDVFYLDLFS